MTRPVIAIDCDDVLLPGASLMIDNYYELHMVTGRRAFMRVATDRWLHGAFPGGFAATHYTGMFSGDEAPVSKADVCRQINAVALIDDHLGHALPVAAAGISVLLFGTYPWNRANDLPPNVQRTRNWSEVLDYFNAPSLMT